MSTNEVPAHLRDVNKVVNNAVDAIYDLEPENYGSLSEVVSEEAFYALEELGFECYSVGNSEYIENLRITSRILEFAKMNDSDVAVSVSEDSDLNDTLIETCHRNLNRTIKSMIPERERKDWENSRSVVF